MKILFAYFGVVLIWATTPLAIQWSSDSLSFIAAALLRMALALALGLVINTVMRRKLFAIPGVWKVYAVGALGIFPNMPVVYWSAQYIPSGVVAIIFAMSPFVTGLLSTVILKQNPFSVRRLFALMLAVAGLIVIFYQQLTFSAYAVYGGLGILLSCFIFGLSSVLVKKVSEKLHVNTDAFNQTLGSLLFSLPGLLLAWLLLDGHIPQFISSKSWAAVSYLAILGSLLGITLYFYVLANMSATAVSLITLMTPILALLIGIVAAGELLSWPLAVGAGLVVIALLIYLNVSFEEYFLRALRARAWRENSFDEVKNNFQRFK